MAARKEILVVGAGIIGASIGWHLARAGARVTVIAAGREGGVATPTSFAWLNASAGNPEPYFRLRIRSMREWTRLAAEVPGIPLAWTGGLCWDLPAAEMERYAAEHGGWGYGIRVVGRDEAARIEPGLAKPPARAVHVAEEGMVEPVAATLALLADAVRRGAVVRTGLNINAVERTPDGSAGGRPAIVANGERIAADAIVIAAGAGTPALAATAGIAVPLTTPPGLIVHSRPLAERLLNGLVLSDGPHVRQTAEGRIIAGGDFGGSDPGEHADETAAALFGAVKAMLRRGDALEMDFHTIGWRPTPADGFPVIGPAGTGAPGIYLAVMHSGITLAPAVGLFAAEEILTGRRDPLLAPYGIGRFD